MPDTFNDHDLLIELRTEMRGIRSDLSDMRTGLTARVLNLESNSVSRRQFDDHETRMRDTEKGITVVRTWGSVAILLLGLGEVLLQVFFK